MAELLWAGIAIFGFVPFVFGWPFRRVKGVMWELGSLVGVYLLLVALLLAKIAVGGFDAVWAFDAKTIGSVAFGVFLGLLWGLRLHEWSKATLRNRFAY